MLLVPRSITLVTPPVLPFEMKGEAEIMEVGEHILGQSPRRTLADPLEDHVAQIVEHHPAEACPGVGDYHPDREGNRRIVYLVHRLSITAL